MPPLPTAVAGFALSTFASALLAACWIGLARRRQWVDVPGARRLHVVATPRGAGVGIAAVVAAALSWTGSWWLGGGVALFALVGLLDDLVSARVLPKLLLQLAAAALVAASFAPAWPVAIAIVLATAFLVNAFNFMDGSNGLLAAQGLVLGIALALWPGQLPGVTALAWCLAGACLGFLPFNVPVARGFLGDVGSHAIGAAVAALLLLDLQHGVMPIPAALLLLTPILLDTVLTLARRAAAGKPVWRAHREHLYQYAVRSGYSHGSVCLVYAACTVSCVLLALCGVKLRSSLVMWALVTLTWAAGAAAYRLLRTHWLRHKRRGAA